MIASVDFKTKGGTGDWSAASFSGGREVIFSTSAGKDGGEDREEESDEDDTGSGEVMFCINRGGFGSLLLPLARPFVISGMGMISAREGLMRSGRLTPATSLEGVLRPLRPPTEVSREM